VPASEFGFGGSPIGGGPKNVVSRQYRATTAETFWESVHKYLLSSAEGEVLGSVILSLTPQKKSHTVEIQKELSGSSFNCRRKGGGTN